MNEPMDSIRAGQLLIVTHGPMVPSGVAMNPFTGQVSIGPRVRNEALVGAIFEVLDVSLPFIAVKPRTPIRNANATGVIDLRQGIRFKEVTPGFLNHLVPPQEKKPVSILGLAPETIIEGLQLNFATEEAYGVTPPSNGPAPGFEAIEKDFEDDCEDED